MSPDNKRSDDYWMGVRDALRMVDSFLRWSKENKDRAKPMEDFIHDGLVAAAKRCESCLHKELGVKFDSRIEESPFEEPTLNEPFEDEELDEEPYDAMDDFEGTPPEIILEPEGSDYSDEVPITVEPEIKDNHRDETPSIPTEDGSVSMDSMSIKAGSVEEDTIVTSGAREFSSDFMLVEPDPLMIESDLDESDEDLEESVSPLDSDGSFVPEPPREAKEEFSIERPKYSWAETVHPPPSEPPTELDVEEPIAPPKAWSPMDEPSPETLDDDVLEDADDLDSSKSPPPPPPPPETEESEEERRRRARRLFFGG